MESPFSAARRWERPTAAIRERSLWSETLQVSETIDRHPRAQRCPMLFPHLTLQQIALDGTWQTTDHHRRLTGTLASSAPFVILSVLNCGAMSHYMKHTKGNDLAVSLEWYQM